MWEKTRHDKTRRDETRQEKAAQDRITSLFTTEATIVDLILTIDLALSWFVVTTSELDKEQVMGNLFFIVVPDTHFTRWTPTEVAAMEHETG